MKKFFADTFKHTCIFGASNVIVKLIGFVLLPIYTKYLDPVDYGVLNLLTIFMQLATLFVLQGVPSGFLRSFCYTYRNDENSQKSALSTSYLYVTLTSAMIFGALLLLAPYLNDILFENKDYTYMIRITSITGFFGANFAVSQALLRARLESVVYVAIHIFHLLLNIALNIWFIVFLKKGLLGVLYGNLISSAVVYIVFFFVTVKYLRFSISKDILIDLLKFGWPLIPSGISILVITSSDRYVMNYFGQTYELGLYALGYKISSVINILVTGPFMMIWPTLIYSLDLDDAGKAKIARMITYVVTLLAFFGIGLSVGAKPVIQLMTTNAFWNAYKVCPYLIISYVLSGLFNICSIGIFITKKTRYSAYINISGALINLLLNFILIPSFGMLGAAWATCASYGFCFLLTVWVNQKIFYLPFEWGRILKIAIIFFVMVAIGLALSDIPFAEYMAYFLSVIVIFPISLFVFRFFSRDEVLFMKDIISKARSRILSAQT